MVKVCRIKFDFSERISFLLLSGSMLLSKPQVAAAVVTRYLQTSITSAIENGDPEMPAPGFLCAGGRADPSFPSASRKPVTVRAVARLRSMEDFEAHGLGVDDEDEDTFFDDSTFDDDFEDPVYANLPGPANTKSPELIYVNLAEPIYENLQEPAGKYKKYQNDSIYDNEPIYANIEAFAQSSQTVPSPVFPSAPPPVPQTGPPPLRTSGLPPPRPIQPPPKRPAGPKAQRPGGTPPKRPSEPPKRPGASPKKSPKGRAPPRPDQTPRPGW